MGLDVSVIVPVRTDTDGIRNLLRALSRQTLARDRFEVVIGDDGSANGALSGVDTADGSVRVVSGPPRTSYAARNRAARRARGRVLAFCDSDCRPDPRWLEEGLAALSRSDVVAGEVTLTASAKPTIWSLIGIDVFFDQRQNVRLTRAVTANLFVARGLFEELGGFDDSFPSGGDYDFVRRAVARGARLAYAPGARVLHPTIDSGTGVLRKVWTSNRYEASRASRARLPLSFTTLVYAVPLIGGAFARRKAFRPAFRLDRRRLADAGVACPLRHELRAMALVHIVITYVAGLARIRGYLEGRLLTTEGSERPSYRRLAASASSSQRHPPTRRSVSPAPLVRERRQALLDGVEALTSVRPTVTPTSAWGRPRSEVRSPFVAAAVCEALCAAADVHVDARAGAAEMTRYLRETREPDGSWCFDPHDRRWPPDVDSTSCALAALARVQGVDAAPILGRILDSQPDGDGLVRSWLVWYPGAEQRMDRNAADAIVTANLIFAAARVGLDTRGLIGALDDHVCSNGLGGIATEYYDSLPIRAYYVARALAPLSANGASAPIKDFIASVDPESLSVVEVAAALAAGALVGVGRAADGLLARLLALRSDGGGWPEGRWFTDPAGCAWRSSAFTNALAVEALALSDGGRS